MGDFWERVKDWSEPTSRWLSSTDTSNADFLISVLAVLIMLGFMLYFASAHHQERVVSKRKLRERNRKVWEKAETVITDSLEDQIRRGYLKRAEVDKIYSKLHKIPGLREVGIEPSFGRPWYYGPQSVSNMAAHVAKRKQEIRARLHRMGVNVAAKMKRRPKVTAKDKIALIRAELKPKA